MIYILGGTGFIGSAYSRLFDKLGLPHRIINRGTYKEAMGTSCDVLINANGNSIKWLADKEPQKEFDASVKSVYASLEDFKYKTYVYLSSCDVYPDPGNPAASIEDSPIDSAAQSRYGFHKFTAEHLVRQLASRWLIFRMGGFVGPGLRKNAIFDILNNQPLWLTPDSRLQYMHTDEGARIVWELSHAGLAGEIFNLCGRGSLALSDVQMWAGRTPAVHPDASRVHYEINIDKLSKRVQVPETRDTIKRFIDASAHLLVP